MCSFDVVNMYIHTNQHAVYTITSFESSSLVDSYINKYTLLGTIDTLSLASFNPVQAKKDLITWSAVLCRAVFSKAEFN